ncbi:hypothetical protein D3C86_1745020 [compost metagenome]
MGLGGEVHDGVGLGRERVDEGRVADVAVDEAEAGVGLKILEARQVAGVGQRVEDDDLVLGMLVQDVAREVGADETGAAGDHDMQETLPDAMKSSECL